MVRIYILSIIAWSSICVTYPRIITKFGVCRSPNNEPGLCVYLPNCEYIKNITMNLDVTKNSSELQFVKQSQCGYDNTQTEILNKVLVCCPNKYCKDCDEIIAGNVLPQDGVCGTFFESKILGGNKTALDEFPWMALLEYKNPDNIKSHQCGGSLINSRYVITAAHCIVGKISESNWTLSRVRLGEWDKNTNPDCTVDTFGNKKDCALEHVDIDVERSIVHELYDPSPNSHQFHDIALIRLAEYVSYNIFIKPICLPLAQELRNAQFVDHIVEVSGWGQNSKERSFSAIKLKASMKGWSLRACQDKYKENRVINETQLCAGGEENIDTCAGDSGGPLMVKEKLGLKNIYYVAGIISYGPKPCGAKGWPGVYTKVASFVDWIQDKLEP